MNGARFFLPLLLGAALTACGASELPAVKGEGTPAAASDGSLLVATSPTSATITATLSSTQQVYALKSGTELSVPTGTYTLNISSAGYVTQSDAATVMSGKTTSKAYALTTAAP